MGRWSGSRLRSARGRGAHAACGRTSGQRSRSDRDRNAPRKGGRLRAGRRRSDKGGFGAVYSPGRLRDGALAAVKLAAAREPSAAIRLRREARCWSGRAAPRAAPLDSGDLASGPPYLAMELIDLPPGRADGRAGRSVAPVEVRRSRFPRRRAGRAAWVGFAHRDLKPRTSSSVATRRADRFRARPGKRG